MVNAEPYYFDTYALIELIKANPNYREFTSCKIVTTKLTLLELYGYLLREHGQEKADFYFDRLVVNCEDIPDSVLKGGVIFRQAINRQLERRKKPLSYIDAITYTFAKHLAVTFLTGDASFQGMENVKFVK